MLHAAETNISGEGAPGMRTPVGGGIMGQGGVGSRLWGDGRAVRRGSWHLQDSLYMRERKDTE